ncbi:MULTISPECIES: DUF6586 family protein [unclassified Thalassolituus]|jgi:hypothetical protein|uniref:DUF6586 family protein n=1 Tax=Oceanospirillaceae TaxID=135620 RepID=UPI001195FD7C|nr:MULTISPECIES: DUF6586 family protein [unclassified Thalassolituus]MCA6058213.1 hypothetical protein [Thalassolituus sp. ST750PaO-4]TVV42310.1 hypothetical protein FOT50_17190 [Thalassolituus sp. C2-1]
MSQWIGFTNQKLYQCRLLLEQLAAQQSAAPALKQALEESALYQLRDAWLSYLAELGDMVAYRQPVRSLESLLQNAPLTTGEMRELQHLAENGFSWLAQMLAAADAQGRPSGMNQPAAAVQTVEAQGRIALVATPHSPVAGWLQDLTRLIEDQRANRQES